MSDELVEGDQVSCIRCGGRATIVFCDVGDTVGVECEKCTPYVAYPADLERIAKTGEP